MFQAQGALNNCVLGNTTIFAESPADSEVHSLMTQLQMSQSQGPNAGGWGSIRPGSGPNSSSGERGSGVAQPGAQPTKPPPDTWGGSSNSGSSQLWSAPSSASLWGAPTMDGGDQHRTTPSSLNSFLPGDLLGEGPMWGRQSIDQSIRETTHRLRYTQNTQTNMLHTWLQI